MKQFLFVAVLCVAVSPVLATPNLFDDFEEIAPARRRNVGGKSLTVREYVVDAGSRDFLVLYWVPPDPSEPVLLLNIRIGGQNRFSWKE